MGKYILKRVIYIVIVFLVLSFLMYMLYNLIPTDPARAELEPMRKQLKPDEYEELYIKLRSDLGLDDPLLMRYGRWVGLYPNRDGKLDGLFQGNFGYSNFYKKDVRQVIADPLAITSFMNIFATIMALGITIPLGIKTAVKKNSTLTKVFRCSALWGIPFPSSLFPWCLLHAPLPS